MHCRYLLMAVVFLLVVQAHSSSDKKKSKPKTLKKVSGFIAKKAAEVVMPGLQKKFDGIINPEEKETRVAPPQFVYGMPPPYYSYNPPASYGPPPPAQYPNMRTVDKESSGTSNNVKSEDDNRKKKEETEKLSREAMEKRLNEQDEKMDKVLNALKNLNLALSAVVQTTSAPTSTSRITPTSTTGTTSESIKTTNTSPVAVQLSSTTSPNLSNSPTSDSGTQISDFANNTKLSNLKHLSEAFSSGVGVSALSDPVVLIAIGSSFVLLLGLLSVVAYFVVQLCHKRRKRNEHFRLSTSSTEPFIGCRGKGEIGFEGVETNLNAPPYPEI